MPTERKWRLGEDLFPEDNILDNITFQEIIDTVRCNERDITPEAVRQNFDRILEIRTQDMRHILENNIDEIIARAIKDKGGD